MERNALADDRGFTIVEVLIALAFLAIVSLALMQTSLVAYQENMRNSMRDEAVRIAEQTMNDLRSLRFAQVNPDSQLAAGTVNLTPVTRTFRMGQVNYTIQKIIADVGTTNKQITINVGWTFRGRPFSHSVTSIIGRT